MRILDKAHLRLRSLFRRTNVDFELKAELRFHLDQIIEENISSGMPPEEARQAARRMIGGIAQWEEECRDMRRVNFVEDLIQDVRYTRRDRDRNLALRGEGPAGRTWCRASRRTSSPFSGSRSSGNRGHPKRALCARVHRVPPDEPVVRNGWRLFDRRHGVHNRRGQPHGRGSTSTGVLDLRRCRFVQGARYSAGAGTPFW